MQKVREGQEVWGFEGWHGSFHGVDYTSEEGVRGQRRWGTRARNSRMRGLEKRVAEVGNMVKHSTESTGIR